MKQNKFKKLTCANYKWEKMCVSVPACMRAVVMYIYIYSAKATFPRRTLDVPRNSHNRIDSLFAVACIRVTWRVKVYHREDQPLYMYVCAMYVSSRTHFNVDLRYILSLFLSIYLIYTSISHVHITRANNSLRKKIIYRLYFSSMNVH